MIASFSSRMRSWFLILDQTHMIRAMARRVQELLVLVVLAIFPKATFGRLSCHSKPSDVPPAAEGSNGYCLSWRLAVEADNMRGWPTVPPECQRHVESYMTGGQYDRDLNLIVEQVTAYADGIALSDDGMDAWILDIDETCISNMFYYKRKRYGCDPYDAAGFKAWAVRGECPAIQAVRGLFRKLVDGGFRVILLTGRDQETLEAATVNNLLNQGFDGYERLIMRTQAHKGLSAETYKSDIRRQLEEEGYRIWGNVGDQWSDLQGQSVGKRTFKIPNPMYFVP
ncbi:acid phosphatase 1 isoform X1 [Eucalyptus grandis]|uniref:acid phosphatase 1 isoform X1 n=2 Tax=Eucalyptus grandis TaxID=71139 RepID=UPI00192E8CC4|nr:acid phosphatase 1 isoform X1 [Eucalyptus grandis]